MGTDNGKLFGAADLLRHVRIAVVSGTIGICASLVGWAGIDAWAAGDPKAQTSKGATTVAKPTQKAAPQLDLKKSGSLAEEYCQSIRDAGGEARFAFQASELKALAMVLDDRIAKLEARTAELKDWFARREQFSKQASEQVVNIYAAMRPEAASEQLSKMDEMTAAAILIRLEPRAASTILNDIQAEKAARLTMIVTGASRKSDRGGKSCS